MSTLPTVPSNLSQLSDITKNIPSGIKSTPTGSNNPLSNLDPSKLSQLTPDQLNQLKNLSSDQLKALNKLSVSQLKNLSPDQLKNQANLLSGNINKLNNTQSQIDKIKGDLQSKNPLKNALNPKSFLEDPITTTQSAASLAGVILPLLNQFIKAEKSANVVVNRIIRDTKKKLKNKGRVEVVGGAITFIPKDNANYQKFKDNFDRRVKTLKNIVNVLRTIINALITLLKIVRIALAALRLKLSLEKKKLLSIAATSVPDLTSLSPSKTVAAQYPINKEIGDQILKPLEDKINQYLLMIKFINAILQIFKKILDTLKIKLDTLSLTISNSPTSDVSLLQTLNQTPPEESTTEEEYEANGREYIIKIISTPSGAIQAVAFDKFSMMKITQTASSKTRTPDQLLNELKQILG